jgi:hypothetical protein
MTENGKTGSSSGRKLDPYDIVRFAISEKYPKIDPENTVEVLKGVRFLVSTGNKAATTYTNISKETGIRRRIVVLIVEALESLGYLIVNRKKSGKPFIITNDNSFFGPQIAEETERCLQELTMAAENYDDVRNIVGNLPKKANIQFENDNLIDAIKKYNEAVEKLIKAELEILPLIEWRVTAFKIFLGPRFYYDYKWR